MSVDVDELDDEHEKRHDYRRANGAPMVSHPTEPGKNARYSRPSGYGKVLDDENSLVDWRIWKAMQGVAKSKSLQAAVGATAEEDKDERKRLRELALDRGSANEAADSGTALHKMTQRFETPGDYFEPPEEFLPDLQAYADVLSKYGLMSEYIEVHMVNDGFRAAGTADRIYRTTVPLEAPDGSTLPAGTLILGDIKTGKKMDFSLPGYCVQCAIYASGVMYDIHTESRIDTPEINQEWALLIHMPVGKGWCELLWINIPLGLHGAWISQEVKNWQKKWKNGTYDCYKVQVPSHGSDTAVAEVATDEQAMQKMADFAERPIEVMVEYIKQRIGVIADHPAAKQKLLLSWPEKLPTPKQGLVERADVVRVLDLLDKVEAEFSLPFMPDPRTLVQAGLHKDKRETGNGRLLPAS
jgi:hypothetical protein